MKKIKPKKIMTIKAALLIDNASAMDGRVDCLSTCFSTTEAL
jgi:uncharacterized protein with von Willebrand factor type A (vWA) domain